jgi:pyruvate/2-oxoglutarate dehydrogenase complex dihydrolipoamide dehydrogenase (E3) component
MNKYDAIIIGSGCGAVISDETAGHGLKTALIDKGPLIHGGQDHGYPAGH